MLDLNEIISIAGARTCDPCLVEVGHALREGRRKTTGFVWSSGRISATIGPRDVRLRRRLGPMGSVSGITLDLRELASLATACRDWADRRDEWWAFYDSSSGFAMGLGEASYLWRPGKLSERVRLGSRSKFGGERGERLTGRDQVVRHATAETIGRRLQIVAEVWRTGERHAPSDRALVGLHYAAPAFELAADRRYARVRLRYRRDLYLEAGEEDFLTRCRAGCRGR